MKLSLEQHALKRRIYKAIRANPVFTPAEAMKSWGVDEQFFSAFIAEVARRRRCTVFFQDGVWTVHNSSVVSQWLIGQVMEVLLCPKPARKKRKKQQCAFPKCAVPPRHKHHIIYRPPYTAPLCFGHHIEVTVCNINAVEAILSQTGHRRKLRNYERQEIWQDWRAGDIQPEFTADAMRWVERWRAPKGAWDPRPKEREANLDMAGFPRTAFTRGS